MSLLLADPRDRELAELRASLGDLMSLLGLPATWAGRGPDEVARLLGEALQAMLRLDLVLVLPGEHAGRGFLAAGAGIDRAVVEGELRQMLGEDHSAWPARAHGALSGRPLALAIFPVGVAATFGLLVVGSGRPVSRPSRKPSC